MKKVVSKITAILLCGLLALTNTPVFADDTSTITEEQLQEAKAYWADAAVDAMALFAINNYKFGVEVTDLYRDALKEVIRQNPEMLDAALKGMYEGMDDYTTYFTAEEFQSFMQDMSGEICGIGVTIMELEEGILITEVHKGSSAEKEGIKKGDIIVAADGTDIRGMELELARGYILGSEGTTVNIDVVRDGAVYSFTLTRSKIVVVPGFYQILDGNIGYLQLSSFDEHADEFVAEALDALKDTKCIMLDLRNNPGGSLETLKSIAAMTLPKGPVMHLEYKFEIDNVAIQNDKDGFKNKLVVLTNNYTASAAEAFAAAVQDYGVGLVVGQKTYGKGTMQNVGGIFNGGGYKMTVAEYLSPLKRKINNIGVPPDYYAASKVVKYDDIYFEPITYDRVMRLGDTGNDVLALEQRLNIMGYSVGVPDGVYGDDTHYAVLKYQETSGLYPYGVADITTQLSIHNYLQNKDVVLDKQFERALEIANDIDTYMAENKN